MVQSFPYSSQASLAYVLNLATAQAAPHQPGAEPPGSESQRSQDRPHPPVPGGGPDWCDPRGQVVLSVEKRVAEEVCSQGLASDWHLGSVRVRGLFLFPPVLCFQEKYFCDWRECRLFDLLGLVQVWKVEREEQKKDR